MKQIIEKAKIVVIKIGSALLVDTGTGQLRRDWLTALAADVADLRAGGKSVILVSSGSIALGRALLGLGMSKRLEENQAAAAVGQIELAALYRDIFQTRDIPVAQILLTYGDTEKRRRYLNARNTIMRLLKLGVVPVINENDTVATDEVRYGDNDRLGARVASMCSADLLFLLSDIDGLYESNPKFDKDARFIKEVEDITPEIEKMAGDPVSTGFGSGGMVTKIAAGRIATDSGCHMVIVNGTENNPVSRYLKNFHGTWFRASKTPLDARKKWIAATLAPAGQVIIDQGAANALKSGKSLLPAGIVRVEGDFERGDMVKIMDMNDVELGRGIIAYGTKDATRLMGHQSQDIEQILGYGGPDELIHRSDLVISREVAI